jgi:hypothetical protein
MIWWNSIRLDAASLQGRFFFDRRLRSRHGGRAFNVPVI